MTALYNKAYAKKLDPITDYDSPEQALADYFSGSLKYMQKALNHHDKDEIEERLKASEKALFIHVSILGILENADPQERQAAIPLIDFLHAINHLISRFNTFGEAKFAKIVVKELTTAAKAWEKRAQQLKPSYSSRSVKHSSHNTQSLFTQI